MARAFFKRGAVKSFEDKDIFFVLTKKCYTEAKALNQNGMIKLPVSLLILTMTMSSFLSLDTAYAESHLEGTNIVDSSGTIYMISRPENTRRPDVDPGARMIKRPYPSASVFLSYGFNSWNKVVPANPEDLALQTSSLMTFYVGSLVNDRGTIYLVSQDGKFGFTSAQAFLGLGYKWKNVISGDTSSIRNIDSISSASIVHPPGSLINQNGVIYYMSPYCVCKRPFSKAEDFLSWGFSWDQVVPANDYDRLVEDRSNDSVFGMMTRRQSNSISPTVLPSPP